MLSRAHPVIATLFSVLATLHAADAWPQMRGPTSQGHADAKGLPTTWSDTEHITWKTAIPGQGWSSPVVADGAIWLTSALDDGRSLHALKIDLASGKVLVDVEVFANEKVPAKHDRNSHASPSPVIDGKRVYVHFGTMGTACLSTADGSTLWANRALKVDHEVGAGGSPALYRDRLLLTCDGIDAQYGVALDTATGKVAWKAERTATERLGKLNASSRKCFGTPIVLPIDGRDQALTTAAERLYAHDPLTGEELWHVDYTGYSNAAIPVTDGKMLILGTGFNTSSVWGIRLGGAKGDATASHVAWKRLNPNVAQASPVLVDGRAYIISDSGILACLDAATGKELWKERIGADFAASPIVADGRIWFFDCRGKTTIIEPGEAFKVVGTNQLGDGFMASPAVIGRSLVLRSRTHLYRID